MEARGAGRQSRRRDAPAAAVLGPGDDHRQVLLAAFARVAARGIERMIYAQPGPPPAGSAHYLPVCRLTVVLGGIKHIQLSDGERMVDLRVHAGTALFMPPWAWTLPQPDSAREILGVVFHRGYTRYLWSRHGAVASLRAPDAWHHAPVTPGAAAAHLLQALISRARTRRHHAPGEADVRLLQALVELAREELARAPIAAASQARATWEAVREYLLEHYHRPLSRAQTAAAFGLHPNYLSTLCAEQGGEPFVRLLAGVRMERAAELLRNGGLSVAAAGMACGYDQPAAFIRAFRRVHGRTPGQVRRVG